MGHPELAISNSCIGIVCEVKTCFSLASIVCLWMVRNYVKNPRIQYDNKEIQHDLQRVNNGASIQV